MELQKDVVRLDERRWVFLLGLGHWPGVSLVLGYELGGEVGRYLGALQLKRSMEDYKIGVLVHC